MYNSIHSDVLAEAKKYAVQKLNFDKLKSEQTKALDSCINGFDTFISLPTGFGKSIVFQCAPLCHDYIRAKSVNPDYGCDIKSLAIVILPLKSLAWDQFKRAESLGIESAVMTNEVSDDVMNRACQGGFSILFSSPEVLLSSKGKELLQAPTVYNRLCGLFVDESHCVVKWGQSTGKTAAFREFYGMLAELRSIMKINTPMVAMTATATTSIRGSIVKALGMQNLVLIHSNPVVNNIKHIVIKHKMKDSAEVFTWLCNDVEKMKGKTERAIVFCQSRKECSDLYSIFRSRLPHYLQKHYNMFHTNTENDIQKEISDDFCDPDGAIRVLFATIAFGLGVDVKGVNNIIFYNPPQEIDDYIQLCGRGGRDGSPSVSVVVKTTINTGRPLSKSMKNFMGTSGCRREVLCDAFSASTNISNIELHNCCDNCAFKCTCSGSGCNIKPTHIEEELSRFLDETAHEVPIISVSDDEYETIKKELYLLQHQQLNKVTSQHNYSGAEVASNLPSSTINQLLENIHLSLTYSQFCSKYTFPNLEVTNMCWDIFTKHFCQKLGESNTSIFDHSSSEEDDHGSNLEEQTFPQGEYTKPVVENIDSD